MEAEVTQQAATGEANQFSAIQRVSDLSDILKTRLRNAVSEITQVNKRSRLLSLNARIEAASAGEKGAGFAVVAQEMNKLSQATGEIAQNIAKESHELTTELESVSEDLSRNVRGLRLSDLALTNIDLIDRNLYERSCDVRWWATDSSAVDALTEKSSEAYKFASRRLGVILNSYTVYLDLVLCNLEGEIIANGRPELYNSQGSKHRETEWFQSALRTRSGEEFGFQGVHLSSLVSGQYVLVYSCAVRENGDAHGAPIGVLGIVFNWTGLAQTIMHNCPLSDEERKKSRVCILDDAGHVLADSHEQILRETIPVGQFKELYGKKKAFDFLNYQGQNTCVAHAISPGFETYATGWHSVIIQNV